MIIPPPKSKNTTPVASKSAQSTPSAADQKKALRLVSYNDDTVISDDENDNENISPNHEALQMEVEEDERPEEIEVAETKVKRDRSAEYGFSLPTEAKGKCGQELQDKITNMYEKMRANNMDMNKLIQERKEFRNPSIYEKLIQFCDIDELGTNYPPEIYDPVQWGKSL